MPRRSLQVVAEPDQFADLDEAYRAYLDLVQQLNDSMAQVEELESFVRSEEGQTFTLGGDIQMNGNRIRGLPRTRFEDEPCNREELRDNTLYAERARVLRTSKPIQAARGIISPPAQIADEVVNLSQLEAELLSFGTGFVTLTTAQTVSGVKDFSNGLQIGGNETLTIYDEGTFTATGNGFTVNPTGTAKFRIIGLVVVLFLPQLSGTSNVTTFTITGLPAAIRPTATEWRRDIGQDNGGNVTINVRLNNASSTIDLFVDPGLTAWTAAGTKEFSATTFTYTL